MLSAPTRPAKMAEISQPKNHKEKKEKTERGYKEKYRNPMKFGDKHKH